MENDDPCAAALKEIISKCDSYRGLVPMDEQKQEPKDDAALVIEVGEPPQTMAEEHSEPAAEEEGEPAPMSMVERPADRDMMEQKRGRGRPRKGTY